jgi:hypothetical protein
MTDFERPSLLFRIEMDYAKPLLPGPRVYRPYVESLGLSGAERVMDYGCGNGVCLGYFARALEAPFDPRALTSSAWPMSCTTFHQKAAPASWRAW